MNSSDSLKKIIEIRKSLDEVSETTYGIKGLIKNATKENLDLISSSWHFIDEIFDYKSNITVNSTNIKSFENKPLELSLNTGDLDYYERFDTFLLGNKLKIKKTPFYIHSIQYLEGETSPIPKQIINYKSNLKLIDLIKSISDFKKVVGSNLELFFYKSENGVALKVDYEAADLKSVLDSNINELKTQFENITNGKERQQIFKNELIGILNKDGNTYKKLIENWGVLVDSYKKSFELYLAGFSFEKIKTASLSHFHDLTDRIHQTIGKVSNYIFGVPIAYIFVLRYFDFEGKNFIGDLLLLFISFLFFILTWFIAFKNIDESIEGISNDIDDFIIKIENNKALDEVKTKLENLKDQKLKAQKNKLCLAKVVSFFIFLIVLFAFIYIYFSKDILCYIDSLYQY